jgi:RTX calcium-binding nonapeptide repeat (4 copies)/WD40-like Beta Propeller Repeat
MRTLALTLALAVGLLGAASSPAGGPGAAAPPSPFDAVWSADGARIGYLVGPAGTNVGPTTANLLRPDGTGHRVGARVDGAQVAFSPDLAELARWERSSDLAVIERFDGSARVALGAGGFPLWSADGSRVAFVRFAQGSVRIRIAARSGTLLRDRTFSGPYYPPVSWSPAADRFALVRSDAASTEIVAIDAAAGKAWPLVSFGTTTGVYDLAWSPDGDRLAFIDGQSPFIDGGVKLEVVGSNGAARRQLAPSPAAGVLERAVLAGRWPGWSPNGKRILFKREISIGRHVRVTELDAIDIATRAVTPLIVGGTQPRWSPRGGLILFRARGLCAQGGALVSGLFVMRPDGAGVNKLTRCPRRPLLFRPLYGTLSPDRLVGTPSTDFVSGLAGRDVIAAGAGDDIVVGGAGRNVIDAGPGDDVIQPGLGPNRVAGGPGDDVIYGGGARNSLSCGRGYDVVSGISPERLPRDCERAVP